MTACPVSIRVYSLLRGNSGIFLDQFGELLEGSGPGLTERCCLARARSPFLFGRSTGVDCVGPGNEISVLKLWYEVGYPKCVWGWKEGGEGALWTSGGETQTNAGSKRYWSIIGISTGCTYDAGG